MQTVTLVVIFGVLCMAKPVSAPPVSPAVQEFLRLLAEEAVATQKIASSFHGMSKNTWSSLKIALVGVGSLLVVGTVTGFITLYLVDLGRKRCSHWKSLRPPSLEDVLLPLMEELTSTLRAELRALSAHNAFEVAGLRAEVASRDTTIANLRKQLQAERGKNQANSEGNGVVEALQNAHMDPRRRDNPTLLPYVEFEASAEKEGSAH